MEKNEEIVAAALNAQWQELVARKSTVAMDVFDDYHAKLKKLRKHVNTDDSLDEMQRWDTAEEQAAAFALRQLSMSVELSWTCIALLSSSRKQKWTEVQRPKIYRETRCETRSAMKPSGMSYVCGSTMVYSTTSRCH